MNTEDEPREHEIDALAELESLRAEQWQLRQLADGYHLANATLTPLGERVRGLVVVAAAVAQLCAPAGELPPPSPAVEAMLERIRRALAEPGAGVRLH